MGGLRIRRLSSKNPIYKRTKDLWNPIGIRGRQTIGDNPLLANPATEALSPDILKTLQRILWISPSWPGLFHR